MTDNLLSQENELPEVDPSKNYLEELVGDNKKFKSAEELARGKYEADSYVKILEKRLDVLRDDYIKERESGASKAKLEELIDRMNRQQLASSEQPLANEVIKKPEFDPKELDSLVSSKIQEHEASKKQQDNFNLIKNKLQEVHGRNYQNVLASQLAELGLTEDYINELARKHPQVAIRTLGLDRPVVKDNFQSPPQSNRRDMFSPSAGEKRTWTYYKKLKDKKPNSWHDPKTAIQMEKDAIALGDEFWDE